jgi:hypothetical protein
MAFEPAVAVYDACVLYPFHLRNLLVQCAADRLIDARWTDQIHDEWIRSLTVRDPTIPLGRLRAACDLMNAAVPAARAAGYEALVPSIALPDPGDRHVVAAAVKAGARVIVTWNLRDFPLTELRRHGLRKETPDAFLTDLHDRLPDVIVAAVARARRNLRRSETSPTEFVRALRRQNLIAFSSRIEHRLAEL